MTITLNRQQVICNNLNLNNPINIDLSTLPLQTNGTVINFLNITDSTGSSNLNTHGVNITQPPTWRGQLCYNASWDLFHAQVYFFTCPSPPTPPPTCANTLPALTCNLKPGYEMQNYDTLTKSDSIGKSCTLVNTAPANKVPSIYGFCLNISVSSGCLAEIIKITCATSCVTCGENIETYFATPFCKNDCDALYTACSNEFNQCPSFRNSLQDAKDLLTGFACATVSGIPCRALSGAGMIGFRFLFYFGVFTCLFL